MANLTTYKYFATGRTAINALVNAGVVGGGDIVTARQTEVTQYITFAEEDVLRRLLGNDLYDAFMTGLAATIVETRWTALKAQLVDSTALTSPLCGLIWYQWLKDHQSVQTTTSQVVVSPDGGTPKVNTQMVVSIVNRSIGQLSDVYDWLVDNSTNYPEWEKGAFEFSYINIFDI